MFKLCSNVTKSTDNNYALSWLAEQHQVSGGFIQVPKVVPTTKSEQYTGETETETEWDCVEWDCVEWELECDELSAKLSGGLCMVAPLTVFV